MIYIQTRGTTRDYTFLGGIPPSQGRNWWLEYGSYTAFEDRTFLMESSSEGVRLYLSAIPSTRQDKVRSTIRYTLVIDQKCTENIGENGKISDESIRKLAHLWLTNPAELTEKLDQVFTSEFVDESISGYLSVDNQLEVFVKSIEDDDVPDDDINKQIASMLKGEEGKLLLLNLLVQESDIKAIFKGEDVHYFSIDRSSGSQLIHVKKKVNDSQILPWHTRNQAIPIQQMDFQKKPHFPKKGYLVVVIIVVISLWVWLK